MKGISKIKAIWSEIIVVLKMQEFEARVGWMFMKLQLQDWWNRLSK